MGDDLKAVEASVQGLVAAWNGGDPPRVASFFTLGAHYVTGDGRWLEGRSQIEDLVRSSQGGSPVVVDGPVTVLLHGQVATARFRWVAARDVGSGRRGIITCVLLHQAGRWLIEGLQNTDSR